MVNYLYSEGKRVNKKHLWFRKNIFSLGKKHFSSRGKILLSVGVYAGLLEKKKVVERDALFKKLNILAKFSNGNSFLQ